MGCLGNATASFILRWRLSKMLTRVFFGYMRKASWWLCVCVCVCVTE